MVTEPPEEGADVATDADDGTELIFDMTGSLAEEEKVAVEEVEEGAAEAAEESLTGEMVTLVSFLLGEDEPEPKSRPSSSSTLSKAESEEIFASFSSMVFNREPPPPSWLLLLLLLLLLTVRLLRSIKSLGLSRTRLDSLGLGRAFLALGSSLGRREGKSLFTASPVALDELQSLCGPISTNFTVHVLVVEPLLSSTVSREGGATFSRMLSSFFSARGTSQSNFRICCTSLMTKIGLPAPAVSILGVFTKAATASCLSPFRGSPSLEAMVAVCGGRSMLIMSQFEGFLLDHRRTLNGSLYVILQRIIGRKMSLEAPLDSAVGWPT